MTQLSFGLRPQATGAATIAASQLFNQSPVAQGFAPEGAFGHTVCGDESFDFRKDVRLHTHIDIGVATRMQYFCAGSAPILRGVSSCATTPRMTEGRKIDVAALKRAILENTGPGKRFSRRALSLAASEGKNPDLVRDIMSRGQDKKVTIETAAGIAVALGLPPTIFLVDSLPSPAVNRMRVIGVVAAGVWREANEWGSDEQYEVEVQPPLIPEVERFGLEVAGLSMDRIFPHGSVLECVRTYNGAGIRPVPGDLVIVQRNQGTLHETTCKRLVLREDGNYELHAESTQDEFAEPIFLGKPDENHFGDGQVEVIGIVLRSYQDHFRRRR